MSDARWRDDRIQFPRLIAEINATQDIDIKALCDAMDLDVDDIHELFDRADTAWELIKREVTDDEPENPSTEPV